jgi:hypothetical protein
MKTKYLSQEEKQTGQRHYYRFQLYNGAGFNFLGDTIVYLLAISFNAGNLQLGYLSSAVFITGVFLPAVPRLFAGKNLLSVQSIFWFLRGLTGLGYGVLFFLSGSTAVWVILLLYTLFCLFRLVGVVVINPLLRQISTSRNRGEVISQVNISFHSSSIAAKLFSTAVTSLQELSGLLGLIVLEFLGFVANTLSVSELRKVPCRATIDYTRGRNLFVVLADAMAKKQERNTLMLGWVNVSLIVLINLTVVFLRRDLGFSNSAVVFYSTIAGLSIVLAGVYAKTFGDRIGSKLFLILGNIALIICLLIWMIVPLSIPFLMVLVLGFVTNFFLWSNNIFINRLFLSVIPEDEGIVYNSMNNFVIAICSMVFGMLGGLSIDLRQKGIVGSGLPALFNDHVLLFGIAAAVSAFALVLSIQSREKGGVSAKQAASMLLTYEGLKAYVDIGRLNRIANPLKQRTVLLAISDNANDAATEEIFRLLHTPLSANKSPMLQSLFHHTRPALLEQLIEIASDADCYQQEDAVFALGAYPSIKTERALLELFHGTDDARMRSVAAKSLGRIGCASITEEVRALIRQNNPIMIQMNLIIALKNMDLEGLLQEGLFMPVIKRCSVSYRQTIYSLYADILGYTPSLSELFQEYNLHMPESFQEFLEDARDVQPVYEDHGALQSWFGTSHWDAIFQWCRIALEPELWSGRDLALRRAVMESGTLDGSLDHNDALFCFYITYGLLSSVSR